MYLNFWSAGCGGCLAEMDTLEALSKKWGDKVVVVAVNTDPETVRINDLLAKHQITYPVVRDQLNITQERYQVIGTPTSVLIDSEGRVLELHQGMRKQRYPMAFIWNDESLAILRENAGILTTEQIAQLLHTNITAVRNMAYRLKLSLRVTAYNHRRIAQVQALYASETLSLKEIAAKTGLTASTVQYIVYVKSKNKPYATTEYVSFETENAVHYRVQKEFVDTERSLLDNISDNTRFRELYLTDGTFYCARNIKYEVFISE